MFYEQAFLKHFCFVTSERQVLVFLGGGGYYPLSKWNCILYLGANGVLELSNDMSYHENDEKDCITIAEKFKEFNESSINSLPGKGKLQK